MCCCCLLACRMKNQKKNIGKADLKCSISSWTFAAGLTIQPRAFAINYSSPQLLMCCSVFLSFLSCVRCLFRDQRQPERKKKANAFLTQPGAYYVNVFAFSFLFSTHELGPQSCTKWLIWLLKPKSQMVHRPPSTRLAARKETISGN